MLGRTFWHEKCILTGKHTHLQCKMEKNQIPQAEVLLRMSSTCTHVWMHRKKTEGKVKQTYLGGRAVNVLHVSLVLSVFFCFLTTECLFLLQKH